MSEKLSRYKPQRRNANKHTGAGMIALNDSMRLDGWIGAVTVAADGETFDGSARLVQAADVMPGVDPIVIESDGTCPIIVKRTDIPNAEDKRARRLGIAANVIARIDYDPDSEILAQIAAEDEIVRRLAEHDEKSLRAICEAEAKVAVNDDGAATVLVDRAAELQKGWGVCAGDLWRIGEHVLACGDCRDAEVWRRLFGAAGAEKVELVVTSPPYAVGKEYEAGVSFDNHLALLRAMADRMVEITMPGGFIFTNFGEISAQSHAAQLTGSKRQCLYPISKDYWQIFHVERDCDLYAQRIWYKPFNRLQQPFWSYHTSIPHYQEWEHIWTWRTPGGDGDKCNDWDISVHAIWDTRNESVEDRPLTRHTAAFPVCLPERAIKAHCSIGDVVADPFGGSGTTMVAAQNLGRRCLMVEISEKYCAVILQRMQDAFGIVPIRIESRGDGQTS